MKKILALMLGLVAGTASFAQQPVAQSPAGSAPQTRLVMTADQKIKLFVQPTATKGQISLLDAKGHSLYATTVGFEKGFSQQFDVSDLAVGTYRLTLSTENGMVTKTFVVQAVPNTNFIILPA